MGKKKIPKIMKLDVWGKYIGLNIGKSKCLCCETIDILQADFHCGHVIAEANGGEMTLDNLRPICSVCNTSMGTMNMDEFKEKLFEFRNQILLQYTDIDNLVRFATSKKAIKIFKIA